MRSSNKALAALIAAAFSAMAAIAEAQPAAMVEDQPVLLGEAYNVAGVLYRPADPAAYDEVGYAAAMAEGSQGAKTANGEAFAADAITAAHKTLPLPSYVEVTALDSGRTILARVNDRGPMRNDRLIGLSPGAMAQLGLAGPSAAVRVRRVNPPGQDQVALRSHQRAAERLESPPALLKVLREKLQPSRSPITQSEKRCWRPKRERPGGPARRSTRRPLISSRPRPRWRRRRLSRKRRRAATMYRSAPFPRAPMPKGWRSGSARRWSRGVDYGACAMVPTPPGRRRRPVFALPPRRALRICPSWLRTSHSFRPLQANPSSRRQLFR